MATTYTNSLDALNQNRENFDYFEIDLKFTNDGFLVCANDWESIFPDMEGKSPTLEQFLSLREIEPFERCTLESLASWLKLNRKKRIITDVKDDNIRALTKISENYPNLIDQFIPQIYYPSEYGPAKQLGYDKLIFTLYRYSGNANELLNALEHMDLFAVTLPKRLVKSHIAHLYKINIATYVHTVNNPDELLKYRCMGVTEFYTDWLPKNRYNPSLFECGFLTKKPRVNF